MDIFADRLRKRAGELGFSLAQVARRADVPERSFAHYAAGRSEPDLATLVRIARALGVSVDYLVGRERPEAAEQGADRIRHPIGATCELLNEQSLALADSIVAALLEHQRALPRSRKS